MTFGVAAVLILAQAGRGAAGVAGQPRAPAAVGGGTSPLQRLIDVAPPGSRVVVPAGAYRGDLTIDKRLVVVGEGRPLLIGSGADSVVRIRADGVVFEGFDIDGLGGGDLGRDASGVHVAARDVVVRDCRISRTLFGVYLREANGTLVQGCRIRGIKNLQPGEKGSGIHVWNTDGFRLMANDIADVRDGFYIQSSPHGYVAGNRARDLRYGLHYMFSDDNTFEDNVFATSDAGTALMYSERITFRRNQFIHNRGFASVGLLFKECDDVVAEDNLLADNARGIFLEGSYRNLFRRNIVAESDSAIVLYDSSGQNRFEGNSFIGNFTPLTLVGRRTDTVFAGNYWSDNPSPDLDGDGMTDRPYRLSNVFDHLRGNVTAADLFARRPAAAALAAAEQAFPVLDPVPVVDERPLARPPALPAVPRVERRQAGVNVGGATSSAALLLMGLVLASAGARRKRRREALR
ncbi:MAG: nitrous oxide reductase family maturation protein NosD [Acidobacteriota bacterium]